MRGDHDCSVHSAFLTSFLMIFPEKKNIAEADGPPSSATPKVRFTFQKKETPPGTAPSSQHLLLWCVYLCKAGFACAKMRPHSEVLLCQCYVDGQVGVSVHRGRRLTESSGTIWNYLGLLKESLSHKVRVLRGRRTERRRDKTWKSPRAGGGSVMNQTS